MRSCVGAGAQLTQRADNRCPTSTSSEHRCSVGLNAFGVGQLEPAAWVNSAPAPTHQQLNRLKEPARDADPAVHELTRLLWCSIDNDDSRDLDQLTVCEDRAGGGLRVRAGAEITQLLLLYCPSWLRSNPCRCWVQSECWWGSAWPADGADLSGILCAGVA